MPIASATASLAEWIGTKLNRCLLKLFCHHSKHQHLLLLSHSTNFMNVFISTFVVWGVHHAFISITLTWLQWLANHNNIRQSELIINWTSFRIDHHPVWLTMTQFYFIKLMSNCWLVGHEWCSSGCAKVLIECQQWLKTLAINLLNWCNKNVSESVIPHSKSKFIAGDMKGR